MRRHCDQSADPSATIRFCSSIGGTGIGVLRISAVLKLAYANRMPVAEVSMYSRVHRERKPTAQSSGGVLRGNRAHCLRQVPGAPQCSYTPRLTPRRLTLSETSALTVENDANRVAISIGSNVVALKTSCPRLTELPQSLASVIPRDYPPLDQRRRRDVRRTAEASSGCSREIFHVVYRLPFEQSLQRPVADPASIVAEPSAARRRRASAWSTHSCSAIPPSSRENCSSIGGDDPVLLWRWH